MKAYIIAILLIYCGCLCAITRTVALDGSQQYTSIQSAINASASGDTVLVYPGRYLENISIIQKSNISVISLEATSGYPSYIESTIIDGQANSWGMWIRQNSQNITIRGFSITNCKTGLGVSENSIATITNCNIYGNKARLGAGFGASSCTVYLGGVNIYDNYAYNSAGGIYVNGAIGAVSVTFDPVNRCSIYNNTAGTGQDIVTYNISSDLSIPLDMFTVSNPSSYYALPSRSSGSNEYQLLFDIQRAHHEEISSDLYVSPEGDDTNDGLSPATALKTIKTAIYRIGSDSLNPKTVHILPGIYSRTVNQQLFPISLKQFVNVMGAGIDETQIIGEQDPAFPSVLYYPLCVFSLGSQNNTCLESLSVSTANSTNSMAISGSREDGTVLQNLRLHNLSPQDNAVISLGSSSNSLWDNVIIENIVTNSMGLVRNSGSFTGTIRNCVFRNATSTYISPDVWANPLIWMTLGQEFKLENTVFSNLTMQDDDSQAISFGGESYPEYVPQYSVQNCLFSNINCNDRGILLHGRNYPVVNITNCTFAGQNGNGEALMVNGIVNISNCVFYNNRSKEIAINPMDGSGITTTLTLNNNLIRNGFSDIWQAPGNTINYNDTNITGNPLFYSGDDVNDPLYYSLSEYSPCINTGTVDTTGLDLIPYDLAGNWRIWGGRIDMGCYEYGSEPWVSNDDPGLPPAPVGIALSIYPNPIRSSSARGSNAFIEFTLPKKPASAPLIEIYNIRGQKVKSITLSESYNSLAAKAGLSKEIKASGEFYSTIWNGKGENNRSLASGTYIVRVSADGHRAVRKIMVMK